MFVYLLFTEIILFIRYYLFTKIFAKLFLQHNLYPAVSYDSQWVHDVTEFNKTA